MQSFAGEDLARRVRLCLTLSVACAARMKNGGQPCTPSCFSVCVCLCASSDPVPSPVFAGEVADSRRVATDREGIGGP